MLSELALEWGLSTRHRVAASRMPVPSSLLDLPRHFAASHTEARARILERWDQLPAQAGQRRHLPFPHPLQGPDDAALSCDALLLEPAKDCPRCLVLISATHGVEGLTGSAVQHALLCALAARELRLPDGTALLIIHALNPWGMAWLRRCDEQGIDVNRNFIDFRNSPPDNADFAAVLPLLREPDRARRRAMAAGWLATWGERRLQQAISGGQYSHPQLPFYGGQAPGFSAKVIDSLFGTLDLARRDLVVLDIHTGLGPWAYGELICDHPPDSAQAAHARRLFGPAVTSPLEGSSSSVPKSGLLDFRWQRDMSAHSCYLTLEFGTLPTDALFDCVIEDHLVWAGRAVDPDWQTSRRRSARAMLEHFRPSDPWWQQAVLLQAWLAVDRTLSGMRP